MAIEIVGMIPVVNLSSLSAEQVLEVFDFLQENEITVEEGNPVLFLGVSSDESSDNSIDTELLSLGLNREDEFLLYFDMD